MVSTVAIFDLFWLITEFFLIAGLSPQRSAPVNKDRILFDKIAATPPTNGYSGKLRRPVRQKPPDNNPKSRQKPPHRQRISIRKSRYRPIAAGIPQWTRSGSHPRDKRQTKARPTQSPEQDLRRQAFRRPPRHQVPVTSTRHVSSCNGKGGPQRPPSRRRVHNPPSVLHNAIPRAAGPHSSADTGPSPSAPIARRCRATSSTVIPSDRIRRARFARSCS